MWKVGFFAMKIATRTQITKLLLTSFYYLVFMIVLAKV